MTTNDVVAEAIALVKKAEEARGNAIAELLSRRSQIEEDLKTLGFVPPVHSNGAHANGTPSAQIQRIRLEASDPHEFEEITLAEIAKILLTRHPVLHGKEIEKLARIGGFEGGTANFQNYLPIALKRAGGFENIGGNRWRLNDTILPQAQR